MKKLVTLNQPNQTPAGFDDWEKTAGTRLSNDARMWQGEITGQISAEHPYLPTDNMSVEFSRIDPVKGAAVGSLKFANSQISIPLIVKRARAGSDPELMAVDIFHDGQRFRPLTPTHMKEAMFTPEMGDQLPTNQTGRAVGGNPYVGDITGDATPLEYGGQAGPFAGAFSSKTGSVKTAFSAKDLPTPVKGAIMSGIAGGSFQDIRGLEAAKVQANRDGRKLSIKEQAKALGKGGLVGGTTGAVTGGVLTAAGDAMGVESPWARAKKASGVVTHALTAKTSASVGDAGKRVVEAFRGLPAEGRAAILGGLVSGTVNAASHAYDAPSGEKGKAALRGGARGAVTGAAGSALLTHLHNKMGSAGEIEFHDKPNEPDHKTYGKHIATLHAPGGDVYLHKGMSGGQIRRILTASGAPADVHGHIVKMVKTGSFGVVERLTKSAGAMHPNDISNFRTLMASNPQLLQGASSNLKFIELILRHRQPVNPRGSAVVRPNIMVLTRDPLSGEVSVRFSGGPSETLRSRDDIKRVLGDRFTEGMSKLKTHGFFVAHESVSEVSWNVDRNDGLSKPVDRDGLWSIRLKTGESVLGNVVMQMFRPDGISLPVKLFVTTDGRYAVSPELFGVRVSSKHRIPSTAPARGDMGVFVTYVNGTPISTTPVLIESQASLVSDVGDGVRKGDFHVYNVRDPVTGEQMALIPTRLVQGFVRMREIEPTKMTLTRGDIYYMPSDVEWVKLQGVVPVSKDSSEVRKTAASKRATKIAYEGGTWAIGDRVSLDREAAIEELVGRGVVKEADIAEILKFASDADDGIRVSGLHASEARSFSVTEIHEPETPATQEFCRHMRPSVDLIKAAAAAAPEALDVVLGLNFINPQNVRMFTESIDEFDEVASKLAGLLMASRLGLQHVNESSVKEAMDGIARTVDHLRLLDSAQNHQRRQAHTA